MARREPHHRPAAGIESVVAEPRPARAHTREGARSQHGPAGPRPFRLPIFPRIRSRAPAPVKLFVPPPSAPVMRLSRASHSSRGLRLPYCNAYAKGRYA